MDTETLSQPYMEGYLRKYKNSKKQYLVLYKHKLEIFENIRKFKEKLKPKKIIYLTNILHILRLSEKKRLFSFALFTNNEKIGLVADSEEETMRWLSSIKTLRKERIEKENIKNGKEWYITVKKRGIGESHDLSSCILLRIALNSIEFATEDATILTIPSYLIKRCGYTEKVVFIELFKNKEFLHNEIWFEMLSDEDVDDVQGMISSINKPRSKTVREKNMVHRSPSFKRSNSQLEYNDSLSYKAFSGSAYSADYVSTTSSKQSYTSDNMSRSSSTDMQELKEQLNNSLYDNVFYPAETDLLDGGNLIATDVYSIRAHLLSKTGGIHKSSTSSSLADDESEPLAEESSGRLISPVSPSTADTFVKFNFSTENQKRLKKKQNRQKDHREESPTFIQRPPSTEIVDENMNPVNLVRLTTEKERFGEPFYEAVKVSKLKGMITKSPRGSNNSTPEGSPRMHNRKYKLVASKPKLPHSPTLFQPPLPKRNGNSSSFYVNTDEYEDMCGYETLNNNKNETTYTERLKQTKNAEPKYIDIETIQKIQKTLVADQGHNYCEIVTKARPATARSMSLNQEPIYSNENEMHFKVSSHAHSDESIQEEDEDMPCYENSRFGKYRNAEAQPVIRGRPPTRSRSAPTTSENYDYVTTKYRSRDQESNFCPSNDIILSGISEDWELTSSKEQRYDNYNEELPYENSDVSNSEFMNAQKHLRVNTLYETVTYDNVDFPHRLPANSISYAEIELYKREKENKEENETDGKQNKKSEKTQYAQIDFMKSKGVHEAVRGFRDSLAQSHNEYLTDMTHKTFRKSHHDTVALKTT